MAIKMTRAEYEAKYGVQPPVSGTQNKSVVQNQTTPIKMTRAEYEAKYGKQNLQAQGLPVSVRKDRTEPTMAGNIIREVIKAPVKAALSVARPFVDPLGKKDFSFDSKYLGNVGDYGTEIEKSSKNLSNKYKAGDISLGRAALGGAGAGALQAMDAASVVPVGGVAGSAVKGTVQKALIPTLKTAAKESAIRGGVIGTGYDVSNQLASGEKYNPVQTLAAGTIGTVADFGLSYGLPKTVAGTKSFAKNNLTKTGRDAKLTRKVEEELRNVENNYAKLRKNQKFSKDANTETRKRIIASGVLDDATDTTGTINTDNAIKKYRDASGLTGNEGVVRENLERLGEKVNLKSVEKELTDSVYASGLEGAELRTALNNVKKEISGYRLRADANGDVPLTFIHDTKIGTTSGINFMTPPEVKAYKKALASGLRSTVENNSQFNVKEVNQELSPLFKDIEYLESLNGRKVKGGKLGKYASQITGNIVGGAVGGAIGGFPGSAIGTVVGGEAGSSLMGSSLSKVLRGPGAKELPVSKVLQKAAATAKSPRLGLPEPKAGLPKSQNFVPIELPGVKEPVYRSPRIAGNTTQYTNIPNTKPKNIDIPTELPKSKVKSSDLSTVVKKAFNDAKDTLKTLKDKNVRERGSISLESILPESKSVGNQGVSLSKNTTEDLIQQAKKYKSAEEFVNNSTELTYKNLQENPYSIKAYGKEFNEPVEYHRAGSIKKNGDIWLTDNPAGASQYSSAGGGTKTGSYIVQSKNPLIIDTAGGKYANGNIDITKILTKEEIAQGYTNNPNTKQKFIDYAKKNRYDAVQFADSFPDGEGGMRSLVVWDKSAIKTKSQLTDIWNKTNKKVTLPKSKDLSTELVQQAKKYKSAEEFVKAQGTPVYHSSKTDIKEFKDIPANGSRYYGKGTYFSKDLDRTKEFGDKVIEANMQLKNPYRQGDDYNPTMQKEIIKIFGKKQGQQIIDNKTLLNSTTVNADLLTKIYEKSGYDGVIARNGLDIAIFNPKETIKTKSQLIDIWNKANKKILPKNTKLIKNKDGSITYGSQKMSGDFKGMPDIEIIKMFDNTPF